MVTPPDLFAQVGRGFLLAYLTAGIGRAAAHFDRANRERSRCCFPLAAVIFLLFYGARDEIDDLGID